MGQLTESLAEDLRHAVVRVGQVRAGAVDRRVPTGEADGVVTARVDDPRHSEPADGVEHHEGGADVALDDVVVRRLVRDCGQMDHGIHARERLLHERRVAAVADDGVRSTGGRDQVEPADLVAPVEEALQQCLSDTAGRPGQEHFRHGDLLVSPGASRRPRGEIIMT
jgi:hypothetical protein